MDLRTLLSLSLSLSLFLPCLAVFGCAGGEQGSVSASATAGGTASGESTMTGGASSGSSSSGSATGSTDPTNSTGSTVGTTTLAPGECVDDSDCRDGLFCLDGHCGFCPNAESQRGSSATAGAGRCSPCGEAVITVPLPAANLVLVADKSASMASQTVDHDGDPDTPPVSRWHVLVGAIDALAAEHELTLNLGLMLMPSLEATSAYDVSACVTSLAPEVEAAPENGSTISAILPPASAPTLDGARPMKAAIRTARDHLLTNPDGREAAILLLSDGAANCDPEAKGEADRFEALDDGVIQTVADARAEGIATYVIGLGAADVPAAAVIDGEPDGVNPSEFLAAVALAGGGHPYVNTSDQSEVDAAVGAVASALIPCTFALDPVPQWPMDVTLGIGDVDYGAAIEGPCGGADGWRYVDADFDAIELCGVACTGARVVGEVGLHYHCGPSSG